ncbi:MAG: kinase [Pseudomonadota bacterium]
MDEKEDFRNEFAALAIQAGIAPGFADTYFDLLFELATGLVSRGDDLLVVGVAGAQGTGKSTFARLLAIVFERVFDKTTLVLSMDDFYLTRQERARLAEQVHPMLRVRGVPGTHDIQLLGQVIDDLRARRNTQVPTFDKASDDRHGMIPVMGGKLDMLVVEGWCWGARPVLEDQLTEPVNSLEASEDPDGSWRHYVNDQLATGGYAQVFQKADVNYFLAAPSFDAVFRWRWEQEQKLQGGPAVMTESGVRRFIMYYERITRQMLEDLPARVALTIYLDESHRVRRAAT